QTTSQDTPPPQAETSARSTLPGSPGIAPAATSPRHGPSTRPAASPAPIGQISSLHRRPPTMQLPDHFDVLLKGTVNLSQFKLDTLDSRVTAIYNALKADAELGEYVRDKIPQGSWAHRTIINPIGDNEFDADFMLLLAENPDWSGSPKIYIEKVYAALHRHSVYGGMPHSRKCRCVRLTYANSCHVDIVPYLKLSDGRQVIVNRDNDEWEDTDPEGFTAWMRDKDQIAGGNLRRVIRLMKYLRDHKNSFTGTRSVILTTLLGQQVSATMKLFDTGYYSS